MDEGCFTIVEESKGIESIEQGELLYTVRSLKTF